MTPPPDAPIVGRAALAAVSPARLELLSALGEGPATTRELARRLGRSRQSLYYHLGLLESAGLVEAEAAEEGRRERRFRLRRERLTLAAHGGSRGDRAAAARAIGAILRLTAREASAAMTDPGVRLGGALREVVGLRGKARLAPEQLARANALIDELVTLFQSATGASSELPLYALTLVLTPAREAGGGSTPPGEEL